MDVEHLAAPALHKPRRQKPHETGEANEIDPMSFERFIKRVLKPFAVFAKRFVIDDRGRDAFLAGAGQAGRLGPVGNDEGDFGRIVVGLGRLDQRRHVRSAAGNQDGDALLAHAPTRTGRGFR